MAAKQTRNDLSKEEMQRKIEEDTRAFLKTGGEIQVIPRGHSGIDAVKPGPRHIKLGNRKE